jgi:hypothetical protein
VHSSVHVVTAFAWNAHFERLQCERREKIEENIVASNVYSSIQSSVGMTFTMREMRMIGSFASFIGLHNVID